MVRLGLCGLLSGVLFLSGCGNQYTDEDYFALQEKYSSLETDYNDVSASVSALQTQIDNYKSSIVTEKTALSVVEGTGFQDVPVPDDARLIQVTCDSTISVSYIDEDGKKHSLIDTVPAGSYADCVGTNVASLSMITDGNWTVSFYSADLIDTIGDSETLLSKNNALTLGTGVHLVPISWTSMTSGILDSSTVTVDYSGTGICSIQRVYSVTVNDDISDLPSSYFNSRGLIVAGFIEEECYFVGSGSSEFLVGSLSIWDDLYLLVRVTDGTCTLSLA